MLEEASILNAEKLKNNDTAWEGRVLRLQQQILQLQEVLNIDMCISICMYIFMYMYIFAYMFAQHKCVLNSHVCRHNFCKCTWICV